MSVFFLNFYISISRNHTHINKVLEEIPRRLKSNCVIKILKIFLLGKISEALSSCKLNTSPKLRAYTPTLSTMSFSWALIVSFCGSLRAQMHSALIDTMRSYAACHMTTAHQRHPSSVPLVLETRSTQTTTHLVDIIQTASQRS